MRRAAMIGVLALMLAGPNAGAVPPAAAGALASPNVEFVANIPDVAAIGAKIIDQTMYVTTLQGLRIYDISLGVPVPIGALELPHYQNEWVDTNGEILLISADNVTGAASYVWVIDVTIPQAPLIRSLVTVSNGHTATCIADCTFIWTRGGDVIDIRDPSKPVYLGEIPYTRHHVDVDEAGLAWTDGSNVLDTNDYGIGNALDPTVVASGGAYGWHGSLRPQATATTPTAMADGDIDPGEVVLGTDEEWLAAQNGFCASDGPFKTSWFRTVSGQERIQLLDTWRISNGTLPDAKPVGAVACSSHWFDWHEGIVANGWYEQGVRFLDVSDPRNIRQVGYYMPAVTEAWGARFHEVTEGPEDLQGLYVYTFDAARGIDVLMLEQEEEPPTRLAPRLNPMRVGTAPSSEYGWACRIPVAGGLPA